MIADHLAVAIKNAGLFDESREAAVMRERARLARALHRLLGVMAPESPGATLDFAAYQTQALDPARRKRAGAGNALPDTSDECWRRMT